MVVRRYSSRRSYRRPFRSVKRKLFRKRAFRRPFTPRVKRSTKYSS